MSIIQQISGLPNVPGQGTTIIPLTNADEIFRANQLIVNATKPNEDLYICHYSLPLVHEKPSTGTPASNAQRQLLEQITHRIATDQVRAYIIADNSDSKDPHLGQSVKTPRNEETLQHLHEHGAFALSYPKHAVAINHTKLLGNKTHVVIASANLSSHSADSPDDNTGFLLAGVGAKNGILRSFYPQWIVSAREDTRGWGEQYPPLNVDFELALDGKVDWLNTSPGEENDDSRDRTEILDTYRSLIYQAANGPLNTYLYSEHFDLSHLGVVRALLFAHHMNPTLDIRFILDPNQYLEGVKAGPYDTRVVAYNEVTAAGIPVRFGRVKPHPNGSADPQRFHDKYVVYNDEIIINGSANLSNHSLSNPLPEWPESGLIGEMDLHSAKKHNREVDVQVRDVGMAGVFKEKFLEDWAYHAFSDPKVASGEGLNGAVTNTANPR